MKCWLVSLLVCPDCRADLDLFKFSARDNETVEEGYLRCRVCGSGFMIVAGIPRMLPEKLYRNNKFKQQYQKEIAEICLKKSAKVVCPESLTEHKRKTQDTFGWEWKHYNRFGFDDSIFNLEKEQERFFIATLFDPHELNGKLVLDAGCGNGRHVWQSVEHGAEVVAVDLSEAVDVACGNLQGHPKAHFVQADLFKPPFRRNTFEMAFSIGVLMHTGDAEKTFKSLSDCVKPRGTISINVYQKQNPLHEFNDRWLRALSIRLRPESLHSLSQLMARIANAAWKVRLLGLVNAFFRLEPYELCIYDWYKAPIATHHTYNEVHRWFEDIQAKQIRDDAGFDRRDQLRKWIWPRCGLSIRGAL